MSDETLRWRLRFVEKSGGLVITEFDKNDRLRVLRDAGRVTFVNEDRVKGIGREAADIVSDCIKGIATDLRLEHDDSEDSDGSALDHGEPYHGGGDGETDRPEDS